MKFLYLALCLIWSLIAYSGGEYFSKRWADSPSFTLICCTVVSYATAQIGWLPALRMHGQLSALTTVWSVAAIACGVLIGILAFGEVLTGYQIAGLLLAAAAITLMMF